MRITSAQTTALMHNSMNNSSAQLGKLMQQMATSQRMMLPSDDPIASVNRPRLFRRSLDSVNNAFQTLLGDSGLFNPCIRWGYRAHKKQLMPAILQVADRCLAGRVAGCSQ